MSHRGLFLSRRRVDDRSNLHDPIGWKSSTLGVFFDQLLRRCVIDAVDLVIDDIALDPLDRRSQMIQDTD